MAPEEFKQEFWEKKPLLVERNDQDFYSGILTLDDVDQLLLLSGPGLDCIRVVVEGKETPVAELGSGRGRNGKTTALEVLYERYRTGSTLVLNALERRWAPIARLSAALSTELSARIQANVYLTPGGSARGFNPHYDTHDVIILQIHGTKQWRLYKSDYELPTQDRPYDHHSTTAPEVDRTIDLQPGSLLYLPRGTVHAATSTDTASLHITLGIHPVLWPALLHEAIAKIVTEDVRFRAGLPIGFASDESLQRQAEETLAELLQEVVARTDVHQAVREAVKTAVSISAPPLRHHLTDLEAADGIDLRTPVRRRPDLKWQLTTDDESVRLDFHNKTVQLPVHVAEEVAHLVDRSAEPLTAESIPGDLDAPGRLVLVRTLLREGFLTVS
ncbi:MULTISPECIES: cupin domain-containing protein [Kitasatospora]|uniref:cupin domain-containing protein n=1 Tax=Kitasatospora TaxID=2063 RepID=UPI0031DE6647